MTLDAIIKEIEEGLEKNYLDPNRVDTLLVWLGVKFSRAVDNLMIAKAEYGKAFNAERGNHKSDTATERFLDYQEVGLTVAHWKSQRDKADMLVTTLKGFLYSKNAEARNVR